MYTLLERFSEGFIMSILPNSIGKCELYGVKLTAESDKLYLMERQYIKESIRHMARSGLIFGFIAVTIWLNAISGGKMYNPSSIIVTSVLLPFLSVAVAIFPKKQILCFGETSKENSGLIPMSVLLFLGIVASDSFYLSNPLNENFSNGDKAIWAIVISLIFYIVIHFIVRPKKIITVTVNRGRITSGIDGTKDVKIIFKDGTAPRVLNLYKENLEFTSDNDLWIVKPGQDISNSETKGKKKKKKKKSQEPRIAEAKEYKDTWTYNQELQNHEIYLKEDIQEIEICGVDKHIKFFSNHWREVR